MDSIITITTSGYLTHSLAAKIAYARWQSDSPELINQIRMLSFTDKNETDSFEVVALNSADTVVGAMHCIRNDARAELWYYGDLFVTSEYRRMGIAEKMVRTAMAHMSELGGRTLWVYVDPDNAASIALQRKLGFREKEFEEFGQLCNTGRILFEREIDPLLSVIPATADEASFVCHLYAQCRKELHGVKIPPKEWREALESNDPDEENFLVCMGAIPVAWIKINGLLDGECAWLSMLAVSTRFRRTGVGRFAVEYATDYARECGKKRLSLHTQGDNIPAQRLYEGCGFMLTGQAQSVAADGSTVMDLIYEMDL